MIFIRIFTYIIIFFITLLYFAPTQSLLDFVVNNFLKNEGITIDAKIDNSLVKYNATNSIVYYNNSKMANIKTATIKPYLAYNTFELKNIKLLGMAGGLFPAKIDNVTALYSVLNPTKVTFEGYGEFGTFTGEVDLETLKIQILMSPSSLMKKKYSFILKNFKKEKKNYRYEYKL